MEHQHQLPPAPTSSSSFLDRRNALVLFLICLITFVGYARFVSFRFVSLFPIPNP